VGDVTDIRPTENKVETWLAALTAHESVTRMQAAAGQVLIHRDFRTPGNITTLSSPFCVGGSL
jgi:hypothetical protein